MNVLLSITSINTLDSLVRASALYYAVYAPKREQIFTHVTLQELDLRSVRFDVPMHWMNLVISKPVIANRLQLLGPAIESIIQDVRKHRQTKLSINGCRALLTVRRMEAWVLKNINGCPGNSQDVCEPFSRLEIKRDPLGFRSKEVYCLMLPENIWAPTCESAAMVKCHARFRTRHNLCGILPGASWF